MTIEGTGKERVEESIQKKQAYRKNKYVLKSKNLCRRTKINVYRILIRPVIMYDAMKITLINKSLEEYLKMFERK